MDADKNGKIEVYIRAGRRQGGEEIAGLLARQAKDAFMRGDDSDAIALRAASIFCSEWAKNEAHVQARLEAEFGRYDG